MFISISSKASHLAEDSSCVSNPNFENGIVHIQNGTKNKMNVAEKRVCQLFLRPQVETGTDSAGGFTLHLAASKSADIKRQ